MTDQRQFRFAVQVLMFDCEKTILRMIDNCGPYVEKIFVMYSEYPWTYNKEARKNFRNSSNKDILKRSQYFSKIELIEGCWETDEDQRNECLKKAQLEGFDFLIIQDADEFYIADEYKKNIEIISSNPNHDLYTTLFIAFWKNLHYVLVNNHGKSTTYAEFAINCKKDVHFSFSRHVESKDRLILPGICYHLSYVHTDQEILRKISIWGHSHQFDREEWYKRKWLKWNESTKNLHPLSPWIWKKAVYFNGTLPKELNDFNEPIIIQQQTSLFERMEEIEYDYTVSFKIFKNRIFSKIRSILSLQ